jgi:hypothetical protein
MRALALTLRSRRRRRLEGRSLAQDEDAFFLPGSLLLILSKRSASKDARSLRHRLKIGFDLALIGFPSTPPFDFVQ